MRTTSDDLKDVRSGHAVPGHDAIDEPGLEYVLGHLTDVGFATLLEWARREAPALLRTLMISYIAGQAPPDASIADSAHPNLPGENPASGVSNKTLRRLQQEHITRVVSESKTLSEAAARLGIHSTTLWRKLRHYKAPTH